MQKFLFPAVNDENSKSDQLALIKLRGKGHIDNNPRVSFSEEHLRTLAAAEIREKVDLFIQDYCNVSETTYSFWTPTGAGHERSSRVVKYSGLSCTLSYYMMVLTDLLHNNTEPVNPYPVMIFTGDIVGDYNTLKTNDLFRIYPVHQVNQKAALVINELVTGKKPYIINKDEFYLEHETDFLFCFKDRDGEFNLVQVLEQVSGRLEQCSARIVYSGKESGIIFEEGLAADAGNFHPVTSGRQYHFSLNIEIPKQKRNFKITFLRADNIKQILDHIYGPAWETVSARIKPVTNKLYSQDRVPFVKTITGFIKSSPPYKSLAVVITILLITVFIISNILNYFRKDERLLLQVNAQVNPGGKADHSIDAEKIKQSRLYYKRGLIRFNQGKYDDSFVDCKQALEFNPLSAAAYCLRGKIYLKKKEIDKASSDCEKALELDPGLWEVYELRSDIYSEQNDQESALKYINRAINIKQKSAVLYNKRGLIYFKQGKYELAEKEFAMAIRLDNDYKDAYKNRGDALAKFGQPEAVAKFYGQRKAQNIQKLESTGSTEKQNYSHTPLKEGPNMGSKKIHSENDAVAAGDSRGSEDRYLGTKPDKEKTSGTFNEYYDNGVLRSKYIGRVRDGKRDGQGSLFEYNRNGCLVKKYLGKFHNNSPSGEGILITYDHNQNIMSKYIGGVYDGKACGEGTMFYYYESGAVHFKNTGHFFYGEMNGEALSITYDSNGKVLKKIYSVWRNDFQDSNSSSVLGNGDRYSGYWVNGEKHGRGIYSWDKNSELAGAVYIGDFEHDMKSGHGALILPSGDKYVGGFKNDKLHGAGTWYYSDGSRFSAEYDEGKIVRNGTHIWPDGTEYSKTIDSYYHQEKNTFIPDSEGNRYRTKTSGDKSINGQSDFQWAP